MKYEYGAMVVRIVDGDTIRLKVDVGFNMTTTQNFRINGIDTPELRAKNPFKKKKAQLAKKRLAELCPVGTDVLIHTFKADKYGRWLVNLYLNAVDIGQTLINEGHAKPYYGGKRNK